MCLFLTFFHYNLLINYIFKTGLIQQNVRYLYFGKISVVDTLLRGFSPLFKNIMNIKSHEVCFINEHLPRTKTAEQEEYAKKNITYYTSKHQRQKYKFKQMFFCSNLPEKKKKWNRQQYTNITFTLKYAESTLKIFLIISMQPI